MAGTRECVCGKDQGHDGDHVDMVEYRQSQIQRIADWTRLRYPGTVTVFDFDGRYLGCMGTEAWEASKGIGDRWPLVEMLVGTLERIASLPDDLPPKSGLRASVERGNVNLAARALERWNA